MSIAVEMVMADDCISRDQLFDGRIQCLQPRQGYRFTEDAVLLAHFIAPQPGDRLLDLGAGCGIISLILAYRWPDITITALEIQPNLADLARRNAADNHLAERLRVIAGDLRQSQDLLAAGSFDWVVCNPPYHQLAAGRLNPQDEQAAARHEIHADLAAVLMAACYALGKNGRLALVYPAARAASLMQGMKNSGLEPKRLRMVHSHPGAPGRLVLVEAACMAGEELTVLPPLFVAETPGGLYSTAMARCYEP
ncbi:MAG: SAM-dependent methyltransferase [Deltaproteobacteria bacterium CG_4_10_14_3_um_filter_60_8]|nr:MAG: SAM-dependent methyltransferase [Deltaproteobacteria bacterium CG23_combo_of_CG06-09_8_20_14_all_60_8]PIY24229.1 MAG: SAM-dependent methyltransferase [Deltaproteobacteria bacterium CG_4_10_14_3_um_filter_60_8]